MDLLVTSDGRVPPIWASATVASMAVPTMQRARSVVDFIVKIRGVPFNPARSFGLPTSSLYRAIGDLKHPVMLTRNWFYAGSGAQIFQPAPNAGSSGQIMSIQAFNRKHFQPSSGVASIRS